ncbi:hypothetical protein AB0M36_01810 [Actinoplanes sp. NPDC051346]|uniref:hypothetical protein n=1 Tax=Actinoplanes sp. NPDC051346 TaxID=3155048 RepID=UPI0034174476
MSYDLAVWEGDRPATDQEAGTVLQALATRYLEEEVDTPPTARIASFVDSVLARWVDLTEDDLDDVSPFAAGPLRDEASGPIIYLALRPSMADEVSAEMAVMAEEHGLICFDPQSDQLRP